MKIKDFFFIERKKTVTNFLIIICLLTQISILIEPTTIINYFSYSPIIGLKEPWRIITYSVLHSNTMIMHFFLNMYALFTFGKILEDYLGKLKFIYLYLISLMGGILGVLLFDSIYTIVIGSSGAIFGLIGSLIIIKYKYRFIHSNNNNYVYLIYIVLINFFISFIFINISWEAHLGGMIAGMLYTIFLEFNNLRFKFIVYKNVFDLFLLILFYILILLVNYKMIKSYNMYPYFIQKNNFNFFV